MVARNITALGWGNYATDHEDANGQFEQNFEFADALTTCDRAIFFRYMVESLAQERGMIATFMPKPFSHLTGNGCHFHMSLWRDGENVFEADPADDPRGMGLSETAYQFIGGLKAHAKAYIAVTAPTVTSYKRLVVGSAQRRELGARVRELRLQQPHADAARAGPGPRRGPHDRRLVQPVPGGSGRPSPPGSTGSSSGLDPGEPTTELNLHELTESERAELGVELLPATLLDATRELAADDVHARRARHDARARTTSTTSCGSSSASSRSGTTR